MSLHRLKRYAFITPCPICGAKCRGHLEVDRSQLDDGELVKWIAVREKDELPSGGR